MCSSWRRSKHENPTFSEADLACRGHCTLTCCCHPTTAYIAPIQQYRQSTLMWLPPGGRASTAALVCGTRRPGVSWGCRCKSGFGRSVDATLRGQRVGTTHSVQRCTSFSSTDLSGHASSRLASAELQELGKPGPKPAHWALLQSPAVWRCRKREKSRFEKLGTSLKSS